MQNQTLCGGGVRTGRPVRVWLVDDNEAFRLPCALLLQREHGFICDRQFGTAEELIAALRQMPGPDAILLDIGLPGMSGVDALKTVKSLSSGTAVLMYSTFSNPTDEVRARADGACGCFSKHEPFEVVASALLAAVRAGNPAAPDSARLPRT